jgi:ABC-type sugar transport system substrate-binding protein
MRLRGIRSSGGAVVVMVATATMIISLAACSSSGSSSASSSASSTSASSSSGAAAANVTAARQQIAAWEVRPTSLTLPPPIGKPIPTGMKIAFINGGQPADDYEYTALTQAAKILGWSVQDLITDGTPGSIDNAWTQVLREKPNGVITTGTDASQMSSQLAQAKSENIAVAGCCADESPGPDITYVTNDDDVQAEVLGPVFADWVTAQTSGTQKPASVFINLPLFSVLTGIGTSFKAALAKDCPGCFEGEVNLPVSSLGSDAPALVVSYLRSHPNVKYVVLSVGSVGTGLPAAIKAAGITGVQIFGQTPSTINLQYVATGQEVGEVAQDYDEEEYGMMDAFARKFAGVPVAAAFIPPVWILTKSNLPNDTSFTPTVANVQSEFAKLWGKS